MIQYKFYILEKILKKKKKYNLQNIPYIKSTKHHKKNLIKQNKSANDTK